MQGFERVRFRGIETSSCLHISKSSELKVSRIAERKFSLPFVFKWRAPKAHQLNAPQGRARFIAMILPRSEQNSISTAQRLRNRPASTAGLPPQSRRFINSRAALTSALLRETAGKKGAFNFPALTWRILYGTLAARTDEFPEALE